MFAIAKKDSTVQREVWTGSLLSVAATRPHCPPHLASPSSFLYLEGSAALPIRVWKRDARCFFDQLATPHAIHEYLGRPPLRLRDLLTCHLASGGREAAVTYSELDSFCTGPANVDLDATVFPVVLPGQWGSCGRVTWHSPRFLRNATRSGSRTSAVCRMTFYHQAKVFCALLSPPMML